MRIGVFVISALGGGDGVDPLERIRRRLGSDVGVGLELQAIAACVVGGVLMGARNHRGRDRRRSSLTALFTLPDAAQAWPQPLKDTAQSRRCIAVAFVAEQAG